MLGAVRRTSMSSLAGVLLALLTGTFCTPSTAHGGCDYPVVVSRTNDATSHAMEQLPAHLPAHPNQPCKGPHCSGRPTRAPMNVPPTISPPTSELWGLVESSSGDANERSGRTIRHTDELSSIPFANNIFHPPR